MDELTPKTKAELKNDLAVFNRQEQLRLTKELDEWCAKNDCMVVPSVDQIINGQRVGVVVKVL